MYPQFILDIFGGQEGIEKIPVVEWQDSFASGDYVDMITSRVFKKAEQLPGIIRGVDRWQRPFVSFCFKQTVTDKDWQYDCPCSEYDVITLFQRYTGEKNMHSWRTAGHFMKGTEYLFQKERDGMYGDKAMSETDYYTYYPLQSCVGRGMVNFLKEIIADGMVLTKDTLMPPQRAVVA